MSSGIAPRRRSPTSAKANLTYVVMPGEGAFYGPKLEFTLVDALGRHGSAGRSRSISQLPAASGSTPRSSVRTEGPTR